MLCLRYHQSKKDRHDSIVSVLSKVENKHNYDGINFQYHMNIWKIEKQNHVCVYVYALDAVYNVRESKQGNLEYITTDINYLLKIELYEKGHYVYIKKCWSLL